MTIDFFFIISTMMILLLLFNMVNKQIFLPFTDFVCQEKSFAIVCGRYTQHFVRCICWDVEKSFTLHSTCSAWRLFTYGWTSHIYFLPLSAISRSCLPCTTINNRHRTFLILNSSTVVFFHHLWSCVKPEQSKNVVKKNSNTSRNHKKTRSKSDIKCLCDVWSSSNCRI